ncbi:MAG TPA: TIGR04013 family B12-binding domain/radical SAM domain-containing protein [Methanoregulaceae archaeon]|nr:TIGR04013 family B12-binding domain/radical SAM domain-containing protein [Methanoregulaceae archaeon]
MLVNWRYTTASKNSYAALNAACEIQGITLLPVKAPRPDITCYSLNSINADHLIEEISAAECTTIAGGPHATACYQDIVEYADYVIVGEGEFTLPALLSRIQKGDSTKIPGVATKSGYIPADNTIRLDAYPPFSRIKGYIEISRGCPFGCAYCQTPRIFGHGMRHRSIDSIARFSRKYRDIRFVTPNALAYGSDGRHPDLQKVERLLRSLSGRVYMGTFPSEVRPEFVTDESLDLIKGYCANTRLHFGAQSGSDEILRRIGRGHTILDVTIAVDRCLDHGFAPVVDFIVGFPFETDEEQRETGKLIEWVSGRGSVHVHRFMPLPGTPLGQSRARPLLPEIERLLGKLSLKGSLTGSWSDPKTRFYRRKQGNDIA